MHIKSTVLIMVVVTAASLVHADRVVRNSDGTPISVRVERNPGASRRLMASGKADRTDALLANWGVTNRVAELRERKREADRFGRTHIRYRQIYRGIEVDARELIVHEKDGETYEVNGVFLAGLTLDVEPGGSFRRRREGCQPQQAFQGGPRLRHRR